MADRLLADEVAHGDHVVRRAEAFDDHAAQPGADDVVEVDDLRDRQRGRDPSGRAAVVVLL